MATIVDTDLSKVTGYGTRNFTGVTSLVNIDEPCEGTLMLHHDNGFLQGRYIALGLGNILTLSTGNPDNSTIDIKEGTYLVRFFEGRNLSYAVAATQYTCGCCTSNCFAEDCSYQVLINADDTNLTQLFDETNIELIENDPLNLIRMARDKMSLYSTGAIESFVDFTEIENCDYQVCVI